MTITDKNGRNGCRLGHMIEPLQSGLNYLIVRAEL